MDFLFGCKANPVTVSNNSTALTTNLGLQQPIPSKLATFVAAANEKEVKNDYVHYEMNDQKTKIFNRKKTSLPSTARQEPYKLAPWSVGLDEHDIHVSFEGLTTPDNAKKHSVTVAHDPIHNLKDILKQHRDFYIFPTNDRKDSPNLHLSSKKRSQVLKRAFAELKKEDDQKVYTGWFTMETR